LGYARTSSSNAAWASASSGAPNASTSVRAESSGGSGPLQVLLAWSYDAAETAKPEGTIDATGSTSVVSSPNRAGICGTLPRGSRRGTGTGDSENTVRVMVWLWRSQCPVA
jgi:hypothetical protein